MIEVVEKRTRSSKTHSLGGHKFSWDGTIGSIHYEDNGWQNIDNIFEPALAPWDWEMLKAGYHIRVKDDFTAGQIIEFEVQGETVQLQPMALEWTNDLDQIQQISMPQSVTPTITNPIVDLLPAVGMLSHMGTIRWDDAYGQGIDFEWRCSSTRLVKTLEIENLNNLPIPEQYILDGGNPVLRLNLIFDPSSGVDVYVDGEVWDKKAKKQTFNRIGFWKDGEELWGFLPLRYWGSYEGDDEALEEANQGHSVATLEKRGNKLYISIRVPYAWLQTAVFPVFVDTDIDPQPAVMGSSTDDAYENATGSVSTTAGYFVLGHITPSRYSGARFPEVTIPPVAPDGITTAYLIWKSTNAKTNAFWCDLYGEDAALPASFTTGSYDISSRDRTTAVVQADSADLGDWVTNQIYNSPEIKTIIQELVDTYDYSSGAPIVIMAIYQSGGGIGERLAYSYDNSSADAPKLHIEYTVGEPPAEGQPYISRVQGVQGMRSWGGI